MYEKLNFETDDDSDFSELSCQQIRSRLKKLQKAKTKINDLTLKMSQENRNRFQKKSQGYWYESDDENYDSDEDFKNCIDELLHNSSD